MSNSSNSKRILLVEDDPSLGGVLKEYLLLKSFDVTLSEDGEKGINDYKSGVFDMAILDVMMPKKDGFTLAEEIRAIDEQIPILFLTAKSMTEDRIKGFKVGGDDYLTKPFSMEELLLRIQVALKRTQPLQYEDGIFPVGHLKFDENAQTLRGENMDQSLTTKESALLKLLVQNINQVVTRENALISIWGDDDYFKGRSMDVFIARLRKYLKNDDDIELINVHGTGFKLVVKQEAQS